MDWQKQKEQLLTQKQEIEKSLSNLTEAGLGESMADSVEELSSYDNHPADLGSEMFERSKDLALRDNLRIQLVKINDALQAIDAGTYGNCSECGNPISEERLSAMPSTTLCLECKAKEELLDQHPRPVEEEVIELPFGKHGYDLEDEAKQSGVGFDGEDAWQEVARYGSSDTPSDLAFSGRYPDVYADWQEDRSAVEEVDAIPYEVDDDGTIFKSSKGATQPGKKPQH